MSVFFEVLTNFSLTGFTSIDATVPPAFSIDSLAPFVTKIPVTVIGWEISQIPKILTFFIKIKTKRVLKKSILQPQLSCLVFFLQFVQAKNVLKIVYRRAI